MPPGTFRCERHNCSKTVQVARRVWQKWSSWRCRMFKLLSASFSGI
jgi:hypothetical protein